MPARCPQDATARVRLRTERWSGSKGSFKSGCKGGYWRLEQRSGGNVCGYKPVGGLFGGRTEVTGTADHHTKERGGGGKPPRPSSASLGGGLWRPEPTCRDSSGVPLRASLLVLTFLFSCVPPPPPSLPHLCHVNVGLSRVISSLCRPSPGCASGPIPPKLFQACYLPRYLLVPRRCKGPLLATSSCAPQPAPRHPHRDVALPNRRRAGTPHCPRVCS